MVINRTAVLVIAVANVLAVAACNSDRAYAPPDTVLTDRQVSTDVAQSEGLAMAADLESLGDAAIMTGVNFSMQGAPAGGMRENVMPTASSANCTYTNPVGNPTLTATGRWNCAPIVEKGITTVRSYAFYDAAGQPMYALDNLKTASVNYQFSMNGAVSRDSTFSGVLHRTRNVTVSGLLGAETTRRWDGFGVSADTNTHKDAISTRRYAGKSADSVKAVVYPQPRTPGSYPLSGSTIRVVSYTVTSTGRGTETRSVDRRVVTTYNGTALARIQSGSVTCTLHLDTHKVDSCSG
jgi:hypothetical protein